MNEISRADMHVHSSASELSRLDVQRSLSLPECATPPEEVYELAKRRGMDPQAVHVLRYGINPDDHGWLQEHSGDVEACADYLQSRVSLPRSHTPSTRWRRH